MCADYARYDAPAHTNDSTPQSAEERQRQHDQLHAPGRAILDHTGYRLEHPTEINTALSAEEDRSEWWNHATLDGQRVNFFTPGLDERKVMIPVGNDMMSVAAARNAGLLRQDGSGRWLPIGGKSQQPSQPQSQQQQSNEQPRQQQEAQSDYVEQIGADEVLSNLAPRLGDARINSLITDATLGREMTASQAESVAMTLGGENTDPATVKMIWSSLMEAYSTVGNKALIEAGVAAEKIADFLAWARQNRQGDLVEAFTAVINQRQRTTKGLKTLGREFIAKTGGGFSDDELQAMNLPEGAEWVREGSGPLRIRIKGWGETTAKQALAMGVLKF